MIEEAGRLALRKGQWKYVRPRKQGKAKGKVNVSGELYNLKDDIAEKDNVITMYPERAAEMAELLNKLVSDGRVRQ